jgi:hypothetical protein
MSLWVWLSLAWLATGYLGWAWFNYMILRGSHEVSHRRSPWWWCALGVSVITGPISVLASWRIRHEFEPRYRWGLRLW